MSRPVQDRQQAESLFIREGMSLEEIATARGVSKATLARWSADGKWVDRRAEFRRESPTAALDKLKQRREKLCGLLGQDEEKDAGLTDQLYKIDIMIERREARIDALGPLMGAMERFAEWVAGNCDDATAATIQSATTQFLDSVRAENA
jgi:transposase